MSAFLLKWKGFACLLFCCFVWICVVSRMCDCKKKNRCKRSAAVCAYMRICVCAWFTQSSVSRCCSYQPTSLLPHALPLTLVHARVSSSSRRSEEIILKHRAFGSLISCKVLLTWTHVVAQVVVAQPIILPNHPPSLPTKHRTHMLSLHAVLLSPVLCYMWSKIPSTASTSSLSSAVVSGGSP